MRDPSNEFERIEKFRAHERDARTRAPLNAALCKAIAADPSLHPLLAHAPAEQQLPVLLLASIHSLVLREPTHDLAAWYPNITSDPVSPTDPGLARVLHDFVNERNRAVTELVSTRRVQTNEVGRCALFLPALALVADELRQHSSQQATPTSLGLVDVGTSAGLTTLLAKFAYRYDFDDLLGEVIGTGVPLLACSTRGTGPTPTEIPAIASARGIDVEPLDLTDPDDARWLQACCWPDQTDRFERLAAAIDLARSDPPEIIVGDAVAEVRAAIEAVPATQHPVATCSWALNYLDSEARRAFVDHLDAVGAHRDLSWVFAESPALTPELPHAPDLPGKHTTALALVRWRDAVRTVDHLATCHPHGYWLHWR